MAWWSDARRASQSKASLGLGNLFRFYFPGDTRVTKWHYAGVDVQMTIALIEKYFSLSRGEPHHDLGEIGLDISNDDSGADVEDASEEELWEKMYETDSDLDDDYAEFRDMSTGDETWDTNMAQ